jgi:hypothetical protein
VSSSSGDRRSKTRAEGYALAEAVPSIKGSIFGLAVQDLLKLVTEGQISRAELEAKLEPGDTAYLDRSIQAAGWYDVRVYGRLLDLLKDVAGDGKTEYLRQRGARSARTLLAAGLYQQMEYLKRLQVSGLQDPQQRFLAFGRDLRLLMSMQLHNFGSRDVRIDPGFADRYIIEFSAVEAYPEALCWTTDGFINAMAKQHSDKERDLWVWTRPRADLLLYRMTRSI